MTSIAQICSQCSITQLEGWPTHYLRVISSRNPKPFLCRDCKRVKNLIESPEKYERASRYNKEKYGNLKKERENKILKQKEQRKKYYRSEKGKAVFRNGWALRRARIKGAVVEITKEEKKQIKEFYAKCPDGHCVDHIIPLKKGGKHILANLQYLKKKDNLRKHDRVFMEVLDKFLEGEIFSAPWIQRKFKLNDDEAEEIYDEVTMRQEIGEYINFSKIAKSKILKNMVIKSKPKRIRIRPKKPPRWKDITKP